MKPHTCSADSSAVVVCVVVEVSLVDELPSCVLEVQPPCVPDFFEFLQEMVHCWMP